MTCSNERLTKMLDKALREYGADYGYVITDKNVKKLLEAAACEEIPAESSTPEQVAEALISIGKVLDQSDDGSELIAVVGAGAANMNVAFVAVAVKKDSVQASAVAREGLIKQGTAKKALARIKASLDN